MVNEPKKMHDHLWAFRLKLSALSFTAIIVALVSAQSWSKSNWAGKWLNRRPSDVITYCAGAGDERIAIEGQSRKSNQMYHNYMFSLAKLNHLWYI